MGPNSEYPALDPKGGCPEAAQISRRHYKAGVSLSLVGLGGMALVGLSQDQANRLVADAVGRGVNFFDVAPSYGDGAAETALGTALHPWRGESFLACKTLARTAADARLDLEQSLRRLRRDYVDLYQLHSVNRAEDVQRIFAPGGAAATFLSARAAGLVRFIGFSSHSVPISLALLEQFDFDSILFPINFVCYERGNFGPQVLERARQRGVTCLALKSLALSPWGKAEPRDYPNCWYRPVADRALARQALRFTLSEDVCALIPPGDERLQRLAIDLAAGFTPLTPTERSDLLELSRRFRPILTYKKS